MEHHPEPPLSRAQALNRGYSDRDLRRLCTREGWQRIRWGAYAPASALTTMSASERHRLLIGSTLPRVSEDAVLSHQSAAVLLGLPVWQVPLDRVHVTRNRRGGGRIRKYLTVHCASLGNQVAQVADHLVTPPARTVVDLARALPFEQAVVTGDAAVRRFGIDADELDAELRRAARRRGIESARQVVKFLSGHSESVGESRSRVMFLRAGLPRPSQQGVVLAPDGRRLGRVDFHFEGSALLGEFDGRIKYGRLVKPGQTPGDVVFGEKLREDSLRDLGYHVARWIWADLDSPARAVTRIRSALDRGRADPTPAGYVEQAPLPRPERLNIRQL